MFISTKTEDLDLSNSDILTDRRLFISLPDAIESEWASRIHQKHCEVIADINLSQSPEILCATVFIMDTQLAQFVITHHVILGIKEVITVANEKSHPMLSLLDSKRVTPLKYLTIFADSDEQSDVEVKADQPFEDGE